MMAVAKNPGIGQGKGGGRPRGKTRDVEEVRLRLSPHCAEVLRDLAERDQIPAWLVVERALLDSQDDSSETPSAHNLPAEALEIARECSAFLESQEDRPAALKAIRRAWEKALLLAKHDLSRSNEPMKKEKA